LAGSRVIESAYVLGESYTVIELVVASVLLDRVTEGGVTNVRLLLKKATRSSAGKNADKDG
jgi:hypothetical protein